MNARTVDVAGHRREVHRERPHTRHVVGDDCIHGHGLAETRFRLVDPDRKQRRRLRVALRLILRHVDDGVLKQRMRRPEQVRGLTRSVGHPHRQQFVLAATPPFGDRQHRAVDIFLTHDLVQGGLDELAVRRVEANPYRTHTRFVISHLREHRKRPSHRLRSNLVRRRIQRVHLHPVHGRCDHIDIGIRQNLDLETSKTGMMIRVEDLGTSR